MSNARTNHPLLTDKALLSLSEQARKAVCDAGDLLISLHGRAVRRFAKGERTKEAKEAVAELNVLANHMLAVLARFDRAEANLGDALSRDS